MMNICMCMPVCVCVCACVRACAMNICICMPVCVCAMNICICVCVCVCAMNICICMPVCVCAMNICICMPVCVRWFSARSTALHGLLALAAVSKPLLSAYRPSTPPHTYTDTLQLPLSFQLLFVPHRHKSLCTSTDIYIG